MRHQQKTRVQLLRFVGLDKAAQFSVETAPADIIVNGAGNLLPMLDGAFELKTLCALDGAIKGEPSHHLGIRELAWPPAHLPDAFVGLLPNLFKMVEKCPLHRPA